MIASAFHMQVVIDAACQFAGEALHARGRPFMAQGCLQLGASFVVELVGRLDGATVNQAWDESHLV
jgi:hypothetical protein